MNRPLPENSPHDSAWPHRMAVLLVCATFPLIWVGGLVTTYDAGMAVPDWPTTYGYGMFSYPWQTWLAGPWDLFVEHGHRQLGAIVGLLSIVLVATCIACRDRRAWVPWLALFCLLAVIGQGVLGGVRVLRDDPRLAMIHGVTGPLFFCLTVAMAVVTSRAWQDARVWAAEKNASGRSILPLAWIVVALACGQLALGAQLRHAPAGNRPGTFQVMVVFHILVAVLLVLHIGLLTLRVLRRHGRNGWLRRPAVGLLMTILAQFGLGVGTWIVKYNWPAWTHRFGWGYDFTVSAGTLAQSVVVTGHVAMGALVLAGCLLLALRLTRCEYVGIGEGKAAHSNVPVGVVL